MPPAIILKLNLVQVNLKVILNILMMKSNKANHDKKKIQSLNQDIENINNEMSNLNLNSYSSYIIGYMKNNSITKKITKTKESN